MKKSNILLGLLLMALFTQTACLRLDSNLYNLSEKISEYKWDNYPGTVDFRLDSNYQISDSMFHHFTLRSGAEAYQIHALYLGNLDSIATDTVILYCHGNRWHMDFYWQRAKLLAHVGGKHRFGVMMIDYRGYGLSEGKPTEDGLYEDADAALAWLKSKGLSNERLIMYGFSMGSAPATELTAHPRSLSPAKLILEAPYASASAMVADAAILNLPGSYVTNLKINNADRIKDVKQAFCWIHGEQDNFLGIKTNGDVIYTNYKGTYKEQHRIPGADHGDVPVIMGFDTYMKTIEKFVMR